MAVNRSTLLGVRFVTHACIICGLLASVVSCGVPKPSLHATSGPKGDLKISGSHWPTCGVIRLSVPSPWGTVMIHGSTFNLEYPLRIGKPYTGRVVATESPCHGGSGVTKVATIRRRD